jgi:membrane peptidoglycan carboxypeptidase
VADKVRHLLLDVVDEGTALKAALDNYQLAGKTGTPRGAVRGRYVAGRYNPNFVGIFPGDNPQYVIVVKLTAPQRSIFAAETAAPVTKAILQTAIAARDAALDRSRLASSVVPQRPEVGRATRLTVEQSGAPRESLSRFSDDSSHQRATAPFVVTLPLAKQTPPPRVSRPVPDVRGLPLRDAVRSLHDAGFRVQLASGGDGGAAQRAGAATVTSPVAGALAPTGTLVRLIVDTK